MKRRVLISLAFIMLIIISACSEDNNSSNPSNKPAITSINPQPAAIGDTITISGSNLGAAQGNSTIQINGVPAAQYLKWSETEIKAVIPVGAESGKLWVIVNGERSNELDFNIDAVRIGTQVWMVKNLDVETYRNGDSIPQVTEPTEWANLTTGAWCYFDNDSTIGGTYGKLYNWYAVNDPRGLAPKGWHVPSNLEWTRLSNYLGGEFVAGGKMKEAGSAHWWFENYATNESGFSALPGGLRDGKTGSFGIIGAYGDWWSATKGGGTSTFGYYISLIHYNTGITSSLEDKGYGFSVRCVRD